MFVQNLLQRLGGQGRAVENARLASIQLARQRVEREEVEIFLDRLHARSGRTSPAAHAAVGP
jgi:hypothetical protein